MSMNVQPDIDFIKDMKEAGGDTLKKCFQCATCSVVCPLSSDDDPFPRREMIAEDYNVREVGDVEAKVARRSHGLALDAEDA